MTAKVSVLFLLFCSLDLYAQSSNTTPGQQAREDELKKHISAAETYQVAGDLENAQVENRAIAAIGLQKFGNLYLEEGRFQDAVKVLSESKSYADNARVRIDLAVAFLRLNQLERALDEAKAAVTLDPREPYARYILGNIYFTKENFEAALPELEKVFIQAPSFDASYALGLTYLHLKQVARAKLLFEEIQSRFKDDRPELHILLGQAYEQTNYPLEAEREFRRALTIDPKQSRANFFLGYVILQHGGSERLGEARKAFEKELQLSPDDFYTNFFAGVVASSESDHPGAIRFLEKAVKARPDSAEARLFLGQSQLELNNLVAAEMNLRRAAALANEDPKGDLQSRRTHYLLGRLLVKTGRKEEGEKELALARQLQETLLESARDEINRILGKVVTDAKATPVVNASQTMYSTQQTLTPERSAELKKVKSYLEQVLAQAFHNLGVVALGRDRLTEALENFAAAARWKSDFPGLDRNWGIVAFRAGRFDVASAALSRQLKVKPNDDLARQMLGTIYYFNRDYKQAVETLQALEPKIAENAELAYFYGISLINLQKNSEAVSVFDRLASVSRKNAEALSYAAQGFMLLGDYERAIKEFRIVQATQPELLKTNFYIGQSLIRLNRFDEAEKAFRRELQINPTDESSKYHLAFTLIERKINQDEAVSLLKGAIELRPDYAEAHYQLGKLYVERNDNENAIRHLEAAARADNKKDYIYYQLSIAYRRAGRKAESDQALKTYQELKAANRKSETPLPLGIKKNASE